MSKTLRITDLPENERPRERLLRYGAESISNVELLSIILRTGTFDENIISLSTRVLKNLGGLNGLLNSNIEELTQIKGIGKAKAAQILALAEISKRFKSFRSGNQYKINNPQDVSNLIMEDLRYLKKEHLKVIMLNAKNYVISIKDVSIGSLTMSIVHPREVFLEAIKKSSASIIVCHNHPSGIPAVSDEDIKTTLRLKECGKILGIELLDHIIIGDGIYLSMKEKRIL